MKNTKVFGNNIRLQLGMHLDGSLEDHRKKKPSGDLFQ